MWLVMMVVVWSVLDAGFHSALLGASLACLPAWLRMTRSLSRCNLSWEALKCWGAHESQVADPLIEA